MNKLCSIHLERRREGSTCCNNTVAQESNGNNINVTFKGPLVTMMLCDKDIFSNTATPHINITNWWWPITKTNNKSTVISKQNKKKIIRKNNEQLKKPK